MLQVYVAAGTVYTLEAELSDLEECARGVSSATSDMELSFLEEQVASAAAKVQQSELQVGRRWMCTNFKAKNGIGLYCLYIRLNTEVIEILKTTARPMMPKPGLDNLWLQSRMWLFQFSAAASCEFGK